MILQLNSSIQVETPLGKVHAIFSMDHGIHHNSCWVVTLELNDIVKLFHPNNIIISTNYTFKINTQKNCHKKIRITLKYK